MKTFGIICLIVILYIGFFAFVSQDQIQAQTAENLIEANENWVMGSVPYDKVPSWNVIFLPRFQIAKIFVPTLTREEWDPKMSAQALYNRATNTIILPENWNPLNLYHRSMLIHEMIHAVQDANDAEFGCPRHREKEAYGVQFRWFEEKYNIEKEAAMKLMGINGLSLLVITECLEAF